MTEAAPVDLIHLADKHSSAIVRIKGRMAPGRPLGHDMLIAEIVASAYWGIDIRLQLFLDHDDLDTLQRGLSEVGDGIEASIGGNKRARLAVRLEDGGVTVVIEEPGRLSARIGVQPRGDWLAKQYRQLEQVRRTWPREVVETAPGEFAWASTSES